MPLRLHIQTLILALFSFQFTSAIIHFPLSRRNGRFVRHEIANLTTLTNILQNVEARYRQSHRVVHHNRLERRWNDEDIGFWDTRHLFDSVGGDGSWNAKLQVGTPAQIIEAGLDMLCPDFYITLTTSGKGTKYDTFATSSFEPGSDIDPMYCSDSSDVFSYPSSSSPLRVIIPTCQPPKASRATLAFSGGILGLSPPGQMLRRLSTPNLIEQLFELGQISSRSWSVTILDAETGVLTIGGTIAKEVEAARIRGEIELEHFGESQATPEWVDEQVKTHLESVMPETSPTEAHFKWMDVHGAATGWWTGLMSGVWVNGIKVLRNQPILLDIQCPYILAPPLAAEQFYAAIGSSRRLNAANEGFFAFPCLNPPNIGFEIAGWTFSVMSDAGTRADTLYGPVGGCFSLGELRNGSGYCVGMVVETNMGMRPEWAASGMQGVWVLGEPFFRGLGVIFDLENKKLGIRTY